MSTSATAAKQEDAMGSNVQHDDPMRRALDAAPIAPEPPSPEEDRGAAEAHEEYLAGLAISAEDAKRELLAETDAERVLPA